MSYPTLPLTFRYRVHDTNRQVQTRSDKSFRHATRDAASMKERTGWNMKMAAAGGGSGRWCGDGWRVVVGGYDWSDTRAPSL